MLTFVILAAYLEPGRRAPLRVFSEPDQVDAKLNLSEFRLESRWLGSFSDPAFKVELMKELMGVRVRSGVPTGG